MATAIAGARAASYDPHVDAPPRARIASLDVVRGIVMLLMAIDHVRVYAGVPAGGPAPGVFFTRWITHFVAPAFVFLAGTSAWLHGTRLTSRAALSRFLVTRGAWLVLLELTVIRLAWTFNVDYAHYMLAGVIWMLGWCMILMAPLVHLPRRAALALGIAIVALHNVTDVVGGLPEGGVLLPILYTGGQVGNTPLVVLFVLVPWIGVMLCGWGFGAVMEQSPDDRRRTMWRLGLALTLAFVALRALDVYGDPGHWRTNERLSPVLAFLATNKYPASLLFLLMTLGPMFLGLAWAERARGRVASVLATFGRVPLFYYLLHIPVIHVAAIVVSLVRTGSVDPWLFHDHPMSPGPAPDGYRWSLPLLYLVWAICVTVLYVPCRWFANLRAARRSTMLSYF